MYKKILVPLDGSTSAEEILDHVENLAKHYNAKVLLLQVDDPPLMLGHDEVIDEARYREERFQHKEEIKAYLSSICNGLSKKGIQVEIEIASGQPVSTILNVAQRENIDLIALASHKTDLTYKTLCGSVAIGLTRRTDIPLLFLLHP